MKKFLPLSITVFILSNLFSQSSRNGYWMHNLDTIRMLIVFAEVNDYATDVTPDPNWLAGELPLN